MIKKYRLEEARESVLALCAAAKDGAFDTRGKFIAEIEARPDLAVQGYNAFGKIFYWNPASSHLYGHRESEAVNQDLFELILPAEMRQLARDMVWAARKTRRMPEPGPCNLLRRDGGHVAVFSGHLVFQWEGPSVPEFYCLDLALDPGAASPAAANPMAL